MPPSILATDGYKFSMAEAGWPLRRETFYYTHRRGGLQVVPIDIRSFIESLLPVADADAYAYLDRCEYEMGAGFKEAIQMRDALAITALPKGTWFLPHEPVFTVTGPSSLVSWLEPLAIGIHFRIQVATRALKDPNGFAQALARVTCAAERDIALETLDAVGVPAPAIAVDPDGYAREVRATARRLVEAVGGDAGRLFEVGLRSAVCMDQHEIALLACKAEGIRRTSNVWLARKLDMVPVGTMGHEHVQRHGGDEEAFRSMRERRPHRSSYLLDTFDTFLSGIPTAYRVIEEDPGRGDSVRFDSGDKESQYFFAVSRARSLGVRPIFILEDGFDGALTARFEELRQIVGWEPHEQYYGYGGELVSRPSFTPFSRDRVSAVYKLCRSGNQPVMKFADEPGGAKESMPGLPVVFRRRSAHGPYGIVGQQGEAPPPGYVLLSDAGQEMPALPPAWQEADAVPKAASSPATAALIERLRTRYQKGSR